MNNYISKSLVVGLTGGICCGKSTVSKTFIKNNIPVVDADQIARDVVKPGSVGLNKIIDSFGKHYLVNDLLDRKSLGELVFSDKKSMQILNSIMIPLINNEVECR